MATQILWWHQNTLQVSMALYFNFLPHRLSACCWSSLRPSVGGEMTWLRPTWRFPPPGPHSFSFSCYTTRFPPTSFLPPHLPAPPPPSHFPAPVTPLTSCFSSRTCWDAPGHLPSSGPSQCRSSSTDAPRLTPTATDNQNLSRNLCSHCQICAKLTGRGWGKEVVYSWSDVPSHLSLDLLMTSHLSDAFIVFSLSLPQRHQ